MNTKKGILKVAIALLLFLSVPKVLHKDNTGLLFFTDEQCIIANIYFEARGESYRGMQAVAAVTRNRMQHKSYKGTACQVVFAPKQFSWTHQQSSDMILKILTGNVYDLQVQDQAQYGVAMWIAQQDKKVLDKVIPSGTVHYHSIKVKPLWSKVKRQVAKIDKHVFYK